MVKQVVLHHSQLVEPEVYISDFSNKQSYVKVLPSHSVYTCLGNQPTNGLLIVVSKHLAGIESILTTTKWHTPPLIILFGAANVHFLFHLNLRGVGSTVHGYSTFSCLCFNVFLS